jgi:hypothetical protein
VLNLSGGSYVRYCRGEFRAGKLPQHRATPRLLSPPWAGDALSLPIAVIVCPAPLSNKRHNGCYVSWLKRCPVGHVEARCVNGSSANGGRSNTCAHRRMSRAQPCPTPPKDGCYRQARIFCRMTADRPVFGTVFSAQLMPEVYAGRSRFLAAFSYPLCPCFAPASINQARRFRTKGGDR